MLHHEDVLSREDLLSIEELPVEEPAELLSEMPEIRRCVGLERGEGLGFRSILERPETLSKAWWLDASARKRRHGARDAA
jgi:hypothetical protein